MTEPMRIVAPTYPFDWMIPHFHEGHDIFFEINAFMGEIGEYSNIVKKEEFENEFPKYKELLDKQRANGRPGFREQKVDELGDVCFYFMKLLWKENISLEEILNYQYQKLRKLSVNEGSTWTK
jgi:NTP pyrophosphatase (non-canonical NTP hydrolase)